MIIFVHTAHPQAVEHAGPGFGRLLSPRQFARAYDTSREQIPWAADNDCFQRLDADAYRRMLNAIWGLSGCRFVTAPDVVGDWRATRERWDEWQIELSACLQPMAYVLQDGQPPEDVPWRSIDAVFVGGSTNFKLSAEAERLVRKARDKGLWAHMGRVNSRKRIHYARAIGCNSVDGTKYSRWRDTWLAEGLRHVSEPFQQRIPA